MFYRIIQSSRVLLRQYAAGDKNMAPGLLDVALEVFLRNAEGDELQEVLTLYRNSYDMGEQLAILANLGYVSTREHVEEVLDLLLSDEVFEGDVSLYRRQLHSFLCLLISTCLQVMHHHLTMCRSMFRCTVYDTVGLVL